MEIEEKLERQSAIADMARKLGLVPPHEYVPPPVPLAILDECMTRAQQAAAIRSGSGRTTAIILDALFEAVHGEEVCFVGPSLARAHMLRTALYFAKTLGIDMNLLTAVPNARDLRGWSGKVFQDHEP